MDQTMENLHDTSNFSPNSFLGNESVIPARTKGKHTVAESDDNYQSTPPKRRHIDESPSPATEQAPSELPGTPAHQTSATSPAQFPPHVSESPMSVLLDFIGKQLDLGMITDADIVNFKRTKRHFNYSKYSGSSGC